MKYCFITGMGRSGTTFMGNLLRHVESIDSRHEYIGNREYWLLSWYLPGEIYAIPYLERCKKSIDSSFSSSYFIDVNGYLQNSVPQLRQVFNPEMVFHLVRDPRTVIPSLYIRRSDNNIHLIPKEREEVEKWLDGDKFQQICWNWASTTMTLASQNTELLQFEKLINNFDYLEKKLLSPLNITLSRATWTDLQSTKINRTRNRWFRFVYAKLKGKEFVKDKLPKYDQWSAEQKTLFNDICGSAMEMVGYDLTNR